MRPMATDTTNDWETYIERRLGLSFEGSRGKWLRWALDSAELGSSEFPVFRDVEGQVSDAVTVQESYFFREPARLALLQEHVLRPLRGAGHDVRVWSAGCAGGEEAYTLAMMLSDIGFEGRYTVLGTDVSPTAVERAERAVYTKWALRGLDDAAVSGRFVSLPEGFRVRDEYRNDVRFEQQNLLLAPLPADTRLFDLIVCRNVLIYFTPDAVLRAAEVLVGSLAPGGWLLLGVADPILHGIAELEPVRTTRGLMYRRLSEDSTPRQASSDPVRSTSSRGEPDRIPEPRPGGVPASASPALRESELPTLVAAARKALDRANPQFAETLARRALDISPMSWDAHELLIHALEQRGSAKAALEAATAAVVALPGHGEARQLLALMLIERGRLPDALVLAREAVYLTPELAGAHLLLARAHELAGNPAAAQRARRTGERLRSQGHHR